MKTLLVDADILLYRTAFASENDDEKYAVWRLRNTINQILKECNTNDFELFVSDNNENNFRTQIFPLYKKNRIQPKPKHYTTLSNVIADYSVATVAYGMEADDAIGIAATRLGEDAIIASIDKDLLQLSGKHYNWVNGVWRTVGEKEGRYRFFKQLLTGDAVDNITPKVGLSCPGVGSAKAEAYLEGCESEKEYAKTIWEVYSKYCIDHDEVELEHRINITGKLVKILTTENEEWNYERPS
jgi:5'-3' exonuclease